MSLKAAQDRVKETGSASSMVVEEDVRLMVAQEPPSPITDARNTAEDNDALFQAATNLARVADCADPTVVDNAVVHQVARRVLKEMGSVLLMAVLDSVQSKAALETIVVAEDVHTMEEERDARLTHV